MKIALLVYNNSRCYRSVNSHLVVSAPLASYHLSISIYLLLLIYYYLSIITYLLLLIYYYLSITIYLLLFIYYIVSIIIYYHLPIDIERKGCLVCR